MPRCNIFHTSTFQHVNLPPPHKSIIWYELEGPEYDGYKHNGLMLPWQSRLVPCSAAGSENFKQKQVFLILCTFLLVLYRAEALYRYIVREVRERGRKREREREMEEMSTW